MPGIKDYNVYRVEVQQLLEDLNLAEETEQNLLESPVNRAELKLGGGSLANISSFTLITPVPVQPEDDPQLPGQHRWIDLFSSPREASYIYRIQPINAFGQEAEWPNDSPNADVNRRRCILVLQRNRDLIMAPSIFDLQPRDRQIGIIIRKPRSPDITGLRIYKTEDPETVSDVRKMRLIHGTIPFTHARLTELAAENSLPARLEFVDSKVRVGVQYFYRVMFVDTFGNVSLPSEAQAVAPLSLLPPAAPVLTAARTTVESVQLTWIADHDEGEVKLQRKHSGASSWLDVTESWKAPSDAELDSEAKGVVAHRLLLRDARGRIVYSQPVITGA